MAVTIAGYLKEKSMGMKLLMLIHSSGFWADLDMLQQEIISFPNLSLITSSPEGQRLLPLCVKVENLDSARVCSIR